MPGIKDWIAKADGDLKAAKKLIKDDDDTLNVAAYHTQQTAEKALKAYLIFKQPTESIQRTHDLSKLLNTCIKHDHTFDLLRNAAETLFPFATYARYPDDRFTIDRKETTEAIKHAENILKFVKTKIEPSKQSPQFKIFD